MKIRDIRLWLALGAFALLANCSLPVTAQTAAALYWQCRPPSAGVDAGYCPASVANPVPTTGTFSATVGVAPLTSSNLSSTIATSNTFQSIQVLTAGRNGCLIQNQSLVNTMWVFFGPIGSATKATSFMLDTTHGLQISCAIGGLGVSTDQISITGTATDAFAASFQ